MLHIHGRVGFEQGPQVNDPFAPEWSTHLQAYEDMWKSIWDIQQAAGQTLTTFSW